jgi:hypothetical protein
MMVGEWWIEKDEGGSNRDIGAEKTTQPLSQDSRSPWQDLNPEPPMYEAKLLNARRPRSVSVYFIPTHFN